VAIVKARQPLRQKSKLRVNQKRAKHIAMLADAIFGQSKHLHGLTKPCLALLRVATLATTLSTSENQSLREVRMRFLSNEKLRLTRSEQAIVLRALEVEPKNVDAEAVGAWSVPKDSRTAQEGLSVRMAAILQIAVALNEVGTEELKIVSVSDDGVALDLVVSGGPDPLQAGLAAMERASLWNAVLLRPIRSIGVAGRRASPPPLLRAKVGFAEAGRRILKRHLEQLVSRQYGLAYNADIEFVHEMRVAIRRLRAAMRIFRGAFADRFQPQTERLGAVADLLGAARDSDVFLRFLQDYGRKCPKKCRWFVETLIENEKRPRRQHYRRVLEACGSAESQGFLRRLHHSLEQPLGAKGGLATKPAKAAQPLCQGAKRALRKRFRTVVKFGPALELLSANWQHQLRIACKKLRYAAEFFAEIYPPKLQDLIVTMVKMQDCLGTAHDLDVYRQQIGVYFEKRFLKAPTPKAAAALQTMRAHMRGQKRRCIAEAGAIWKSFQEDCAQEEFKELIRSPRTC
jgi:CHAD domain-containing protein